MAVNNESVQLIRDLRPNVFPEPKITEAEFRKACGGGPIWHSVDLGNLWIEGNKKTADVLAKEIVLADMPDFSSKTVVDIGAWGGFFSFEAARRGGEVTAVDYFSWITDFPALHAWYNSEKALGRKPNNYEPPEHCRNHRTLPGRRPFDLANKLLGNPVRPIVSTLLGLPEGEVFDYALYLGVLYHTKDPFSEIEKLSRIVSDGVIIETLAMFDPDRTDKCYWDFHGGDESVNNDPTTYWSPSVKGLQHMLNQVGFPRVEVKSNPVHSNRPHLYRLWLHAYR